VSGAEWRAAFEKKKADPLAGAGLSSRAALSPLYP
jgi:hypothetical protein